MPPRYAYWTILIDDKPTAFRAREREELLPTFHQLQRKNTNVAVKWFARDRLWESQQDERDDFQRRKRAAAAPFDRAAPPAGEKRSGDWRPGGAHKDPRDRFKKKNRPERAWSDKDEFPSRDRDKGGPPRGDRPWAAKPRTDRKPWQPKPEGAGARKPWNDRPPEAADRGTQRSSHDRPPSGGGWSDRPPKAADRGTHRSSQNPPPSEGGWTPKPPTGQRADRKPWQGKPQG